MRVAKIFFFIAAIGFATVKAQSPAPVVVQAAAPTMPAKPAVANVPAAVASSVPEAIQVLEQVKAANDEVLAKQKAALEKLDELQQAADQLRIFAKRG